MSSNLKTTDESLRTPIDGSEFVRLATPGANWKAPLSSVFSALGISGAQGVMPFATVADAQAGDIPNACNNIQVMGYKIPGDGGAATYQRVSSLVSPYTGMGIVIPPLPPSLTSGGFPATCFATTWQNNHNSFADGSTMGPTSQPILAGCLTILTVFNDDTNTPPASYTDSAGNTYLLAVHELGDGGWDSVSLYYCANPVFAAAGTTFFISPKGSIFIYVHCFPGFTGAVLDKTAAQSLGVATGAAIPTGTLTGFPELAIGVAATSSSPVFTIDATPTYSLTAGWFDIAPPIFGRNPMAFAIAPSTEGLTFAPSWPSSVHSSAIVATFKTYPSASIDPSFWSMYPSHPLHTAQYGIDPAAPDNYTPFTNFSNYLASLATPSGEVTFDHMGVAGGTVAISIGNPAVITVTMASTGRTHNLHAGSIISFFTTGTLPTGIVAGKRYFVQYGTVTPTTFQISDATIFDGSNKTVAKGAPIATSGSQSGTHSYITYGESWTDFILDPGIYWASQNQVPGTNVGLKKWRLLGSGARIETNFNVGAPAWDDVNATGTNSIAFSAQFHDTRTNSGAALNFVTLLTPALASNFYVNSWVCLMGIEMLSSVTGNWNPAIFEFAKIKSTNTSTGVITFYEQMQYNYRTTYPKFAPPAGAWSGAICGPGTIVQLSDIFDQEVQIRDLNICGPTEAAVTCLSARFIDCDIWGFGFKCGPYPTFIRNYTMERCNYHNSIIEVDKMIDTMQFIDCTFDQTSYLLIQSASINKFIIERCKMLGGMSGTPKDLTIRDSYFVGQLLLGPVYGTTERITLINSHIQETENANQQQELVHVVDLTFSNGTLKRLVGQTGGVFTPWNGPNSPSICPVPWAIPGAKIVITHGSVQNGPFWNANSTMGMIKAFTILDVYMDVSGNFCVDTDLTALPNTAITITGTVSGNTLTVTAISPASASIPVGMEISGGGLPVDTVITNGIGFPNTSSGLGAYTINHSATIGSTAFTGKIDMAFLPHTCPRLTVINCTGGALVANMAGAPPDIPIHSYFRRAFAGFSDYSMLPLAGNLISYVIDVKRPHTGATSTCFLDITFFGYTVSGGITILTWSKQTVNLKLAGVRTITATGVTGNLTGDVLTAMPLWITGTHKVEQYPSNTSDALSTMPFFIITAQADQGIDFAGLGVFTGFNNTSVPNSEVIADTVSDLATLQG